MSLLAAVFVAGRDIRIFYQIDYSNAKDGYVMNKMDR